MIAQNETDVQGELAKKKKKKKKIIAHSYKYHIGRVSVQGK